MGSSFKSGTNKKVLTQNYLKKNLISILKNITMLKKIVHPLKQDPVLKKVTRFLKLSSYFFKFFHIINFCFGFLSISIFSSFLKKD